MSLLVGKGLTLEIAGSPLLSAVNFKIEAGEKVGLVGANGVGKTTLLRAIIGEFPYQGDLQCSFTLGYLPQTMVDLKEEGTVWDSLLAERNDILEMRKQLQYLEKKMSQEADEKILHQYGRLTEKYERSGGYALEAKIRRLIFGLGLEPYQNTETRVLSGGQKTRVSLGKLLLREPELLILDEPTNHLDLEALEWLENYLSEYPGAILLVSHDRYFLDQIATKIFSLREGTLKTYTGNYSDFELQLALEEKTKSREAEKINKKIANLEEYIRRHRAGIKAKQARGRETQLKKITPVTGPKTEKSIKMNLQTSTRAGDRVLEIEDLSIAYEGRTIFKNVNLELQRGDKIALLGKNGIGKTSLLKAIIGEVPYKGSIKPGANVKIGYFSQEHENIGQKENVKDVMDELRYSTDLHDPEIRSVLARFGFRGEEVFKPHKNLSGGEKSRLALCKLFLAEGNLLLLDEPTNHLDMRTRDVLEEALLDFNGTMIVISHDRYFVNRLVDKIALLTAEGLRIIAGDYTTYREAVKEEEEKNSLPKKETDQTAKKYLLESKEIRRQERKIKQLEESIESLEKELEELETKMHDLAGDYELALKLHHEHQELQREYNDLLQQWLELEAGVKNTPL
jgi:ATP-binding cassette subfamily F protein 3